MKRLLQYASVGVVGLLLGTLASQTASSRPDAFDPVRLAAAAYMEGFDSVGAIARSADLVVVGTLVDISRSRSIDVQGDIVHFASYVIAVDEVLAGSRLDRSGGQTISLEFVLPDGTTDSQLAEVDSQLPAHQSLFFLRSKGRIGDGRLGLENFEYYYMPTPDSVLTFTGGSVEAPYSDDHDFALREDSRRFKSFRALVDHARSEGSRGRGPVDPERDGRSTSVDDLRAKRDRLAEHYE